MEIEFVDDKELMFWSSIFNLNRTDSEKMGYEFEQVLSEYTVSEVTKKIIKEGVFSASTEKINTAPELQKIKEINWNAWLKYWEKTHTTMDSIRSAIQKNAESFNFDSLAPVEKFFGYAIPKRIRLILCPGSTTLFGKGNVDFRYSKDVVLLFPRNYQNFSEETIFKDFAVLIHELIHFTQKNIYFKEDRNFIEAVTRVFAPKGIIISSGPMPENSPESRMRPIIKKAMANRQTCAHIRTELQQEMK